MRKTKLVAGEYYHIYNRGIDGSNIFFSRENYLFFLRRLRQYCSAEISDVIAYCLMPDHYHFLVYLETDDFGLHVMQPLTVSYSKAINKQCERNGHLFQGPFQAIRVDKDVYLLHLSRYIHLNPVTAVLVQKSEAWEFSSFLDYVGLRQGTLPHPEIILQQFKDPAAYSEFVCTSSDTHLSIPETLFIDV